MSAATANGSRAGVPLRGVVASIVASVLFGIIALIAANVPEFAPEEVTGWRVVFIVIALLLVHIPRVQRREFVADALRIVRSVKLIIVVIACTTIMWFQLWVFMWAPAHGHTADVAMGYFLLPLVMVVVGRFIFKDPMSRWQLAAVISASVGVAAQLIITRSVGWPVLLIAGLYPVYFGLRRWCKIDNNHVFLIETVLLLVPSVFFIATGAFSRGVVPESTLNLLILAVLSAVAMTLYIAASGLLPLGLFGLMSYLEPVLLMVAAVILGAALGVTDLFVYGPIVLALIFLIIGGVRAGRAPAALVSGQAALLPVTGSIPVVRDESDEA